MSCKCALWHFVIMLCCVLCGNLRLASPPPAGCPDCGHSSPHSHAYHQTALLYSIRLQQTTMHFSQHIKNKSLSLTIAQWICWHIARWKVWLKFLLEKFYTYKILLRSKKYQRLQLPEFIPRHLTLHIIENNFEYIHIYALKKNEQW